MGRPKKEKKEDIEKDLGVPAVSQVTDLYTREKIPLALDSLNWFLGGGVPFSTIVEVYGPPRGGKSTLVYSTAGEFFRTYKTNGIVIIIDSEWSAEKTRLELMGVDFKRVYSIKANTLEDGFIAIHDIVKKSVEKKKDVKMMVIWDSIAAAPTQAALDNPGVLNAGGMNERQRIIKNELTKLSPILSNNISIWLLNQIYTNTSGYGEKFMTGGGMGLKHGKQYSFEVLEGEEEFESFVVKNKHSRVNIKKTKFTPAAKNFPLVINSLEGGLIDRDLSLLDFMIDNGLFSETERKDGKNSGFYVMPGFEKKWRRFELFDKMKENPKMKEYFKFVFLKFLCGLSPYMRLVYSKMWDEKDIVSNIEENLQKVIKEIGA